MHFFHFFRAGNFTSCLAQIPRAPFGPYTKQAAPRGIANHSQLCSELASAAIPLVRVLCAFAKGGKGDLRLLQ